MTPTRITIGWALMGVLLLTAPVALGQLDGGQDNLPMPIPPPLPKPPPPEDAVKFDSVIDPAPNEEWTLPDDLLAALQATAGVYADYARRFVCVESARSAEYDAAQEVKREKRREYGYLLLRGTVGEAVREYRQKRGRDGDYKGVVEDAELFPPAYAWVFLFGEFFEPFFDFRLVDTRFEGFDLVHEIHFRGSLPFREGKDIREWEGKVLTDAFYFTPLVLEAEPLGQRERLDALFRLWSQSFNLLGFRTGPKPLGYRARVEFGLKKGDLRLPTMLRYDTSRVVGPGEMVRLRASVRSYSEYRFTDVSAEDPRIGPVVPSRPTATAGSGGSGP